MNIILSLIFGIAGIISLCGLCLFHCELKNEINIDVTLSADDKRDAWTIRAYFIVITAACMLLADYFLRT